ncbi:MAG: hypothetical protein V2I24_07120 [Halieaceae bacterium]|nr:hypothetical protein [Halieaceae bacterium]
MIEAMAQPVDAEDVPSAEELEQQLIENLHMFASRLTRLAQEQVAAKQEIEQRWLEDLRQYHGKYAPGDLARMQAAGGSQVFVNITRNKTQAFAARLQDMLFPTDDRSWAIHPTPVPEMRGSGDIDPATGQAVDREAEAAIAAEAMQEQIDDQLTECRYQSIARDVIDDAAVLGTGIIKGPVIVGRTEKSWYTRPDGISVLEIAESLTPASERVSPWDFFPDMDATTVDDAEFIFQRHRMTKRRLREFARLPGVLVDEIRSVMRVGEGADRIGQDHLSDIREITGVATLQNDRGYEIWEYHGPISKSDLCSCLQAAGTPMPEEELDELDDEVSAVVFFARNRVLKVSLNPLETDDRPYSVFNAEKDPSCIFGFGIPRLMQQAQKVMNAAWRMMMDNAGMSVADQLVINRELIEPADGSWNITPKKLWYLIDKTRSVQEAFGTFNTPSHQVELANIFSLARQLADEETNLPLIAQGEQTANMTQTANGMAMLMNSANIVLRRAVKNWDDDITRPMIGRFYDWNMQYSNRPEIKGDFSIEARGSGALLVREKQQQNLMLYANLSASNPEIALRRDWAGLDREIAKSLEVPYEQITLEDAEIDQLREQQAAAVEQVDPGAEARMAEINARVQMKQADREDAREKRQYEAEIQVARLQMEREIKLIEIAARENMTMAQLEAKLQLGAMQDKTAREKAAADTALRRTDTQLKAQNLAMGYDAFS